MSDENAKEAAEKAEENVKQTGRQAKAASKNSAKALRAVAEEGAEKVVDEVRDTAEKLEGTAHDAAEAAKKIDVGVLGKISSDTGVAFLATSVSIYAGIVAYSKFRQAFSGGAHVID